MGRELRRQLERRVSDDHFDAVRGPTLEQEVATGMVLIRRAVVDQIGRDHPMRNVTKYPHDSVKTAGKLLDRPRKWFGAQQRERGHLGRFVEIVTAGGVGVTDQHYGVPLATRFYQNKPPTILDAPLNFSGDAVNIPDPETPTGVRGVGEPPVGAAYGAIMNAIADAVGDEVFRRSPVTPDIILNALENGGTRTHEALTAHI